MTLVSRPTWLAIVALLLWVGSEREVALGSPDGSAPTVDVAWLGYDGPICGLYSLYTAALLLGEEVDFRAIYRPEFVSSHRGSTYEELHRAATVLGLRSASYVGLSPADLRAYDGPVIMHVRANHSRPDYDHFLTLVGVEGERAVVIDQGDLHELPFADLLSRWNGTALVIGGDSASLAELASASTRRGWLIIAGVAASALLFRRSLQRPAPCRRCFLRDLRSGLAVVFVGALAGTAWHAWADFGLLRSPETVQDVEEWATDAFLPTIRPQQLKSLRARDQSVLVIDARAPEQFGNAAIPGAINLPWGSPISREDRHRLDSASVIVIYCSDRQCGLSHRFAQKLRRDGYDNVRILEGGLEAWNRADA